MQTKILTTSKIGHKYEKCSTSTFLFNVINYLNVFFIFLYNYLTWFLNASFKSANFKTKQQKRNTSVMNSSSPLCLCPRKYLKDYKKCTNIICTTITTKTTHDKIICFYISTFPLCGKVKGQMACQVHFSQIFTQCVWQSSYTHTRTHMHRTTSINVDLYVYCACVYWKKDVLSN